MAGHTPAMVFQDRDGGLVEIDLWAVKAVCDHWQESMTGLRGSIMERQGVAEAEDAHAAFCEAVEAEYGVPPLTILRAAGQVPLMLANSEVRA